MAKRIYFFLLELFDTIVSIVLVFYLSSFKTARRISKKRVTDDEVHILANGPSLKTMITDHKDFLAKLDTLAVNHFANNPVFFEIKPKYYVLLDPAFFDGYCKAELQDKIPVLLNSLSKVDWPMSLFVPYTKTVIEDTNKRLNNPNIMVIPFNSTRVIGLKKFRNFMYAHNLGIPSSKNVLLPSILLMINLNYKKVYLYGAEFSWTKTYNVDVETGKIYTDDAHFYDNNRIYLRKGEFKFNLSCLVEALNATDYYQEYTEYKGMKVINRTPGSFIDAFPYEYSDNIGTHFNSSFKNQLKDC